MEVEYFFDGPSDRPQIRLSKFDTVGACRLKSLFGALAAGQAQEFILTELPDVSGVGCRLALRVSSQDRGVARLGDAMSFDWLLTPQGWRSVADLIEPFCRGMESAQYDQWLDETSGTSVFLSPSGYW